MTKKGKEKKPIYRYESWSYTITPIEKVMGRIEELYSEGWELVSHSHHHWGISIILRRRNDQ